jgi:hypothetical protein
MKHRLSGLFRQFRKSQSRRSLIRDILLAIDEQFNRSELLDSYFSPARRTRYIGETIVVICVQGSHREICVFDNEDMNPIRYSSNRKGTVLVQVTTFTDNQARWSHELAEVNWLPGGDADPPFVWMILKPDADPVKPRRAELRALAAATALTADELQELWTTVATPI